MRAIASKTLVDIKTLENSFEHTDVHVEMSCSVLDNQQKKIKYSESCMLKLNYCKTSKNIVRRSEDEKQSEVNAEVRGKNVRRNNMIVQKCQKEKLLKLNTVSTNLITKLPLLVAYIKNCITMVFVSLYFSGSIKRI